MKYSILLCLASFLLLFSVSTSYAQGAKNFQQARAITFPSVSVGKSLVKSVIIYNIDSNLTLRGLIGAPASANFALVSANSFSLAPRTADTILIRFQPTAAGTFVDSLWITHDGDTSARFSMKNPSKLKFSGIGLAANDSSARIALSTGFGISFGKITLDSSGLAKFYIRNVSDTVRMLHGTIHGLIAPFSLASGDSDFNISTGDTAFFQFKFSPTLAKAYTDTLHISSNADSAHSNLSFLLIGTGAQPVAPADTPKVSISIPTVYFGGIKVGDSSRHMIILTNTTATNSQLLATITQPSAPFTIAGAASQLKIAQGASDTLYVAFTPTVAGSFYDSIVIRTNSTFANRRIVIPLTAFGVPTADVRPLQAQGIHVHVSPNPVADRLTIELGTVQASSATLSLIDLTGNLVSQIYHGNLSPDFSLKYNVRELPSGIYFLKLEAQGQSTLLKVAIEH